MGKIKTGAASEANTRDVGGGGGYDVGRARRGVGGL